MNARHARRWANMMIRCYDPSCDAYARYGGRGIKVCKRWHDYRNFAKDLTDAPPGTSLNRIDNDGDYCPSNVEWATSRTQANNRANCVYLVHDGRRLTVAQWARETGINVGTLYSRLRSSRDLGAIIEELGGSVPANRPIAPAGLSHESIYEHEGRSLTLNRWAAEVGIKKQTLYCRINNGWPLAEALSRPVMKREIEVGGGEVTSVSRAARELGIKRTTLQTRMRRGLGDSEAMSRPVEHKTTWTHRGRTMSIPQWAKEVGIRHGTLRDRRKRGWSIARALETPAIPRGKAGDS